ncbi:MAG: periplasmic heavy metal sensor [Candidatus Omnitrophica bacterium]|nr:periplasmic heavy metal sensor [Candidatus Omnitrophota bacterium]
MRNLRLQRLAILIVVFLLGLSLGWVGGKNQSMSHKKWHDPQQRLEHFSRALNLNEQQATQLQTILNSKREQFRGLREQMKPQMEALREKTNVEILSMLNPEQQEKYKALEAARQDHQARRGNRHQRMEWESK